MPGLDPGIHHCKLVRSDGSPGIGERSDAVLPTAMPGDDDCGYSMGRLTTHVLDTASGKPAAGVRVVLRRDGEAAVVAEGATNADGRMDKPLLEGGAFKKGRYELTFYVGDYFRKVGVPVADPAFLDVIPLRFGIADDAHYHVPLLVSPNGYSTYRGS